MEYHLWGKEELRDVAKNSMTWALVSRATSRVAIGERFGQRSSSCFRSRT